MVLTIERSVLLIVCSFFVHFMSWGMTMSMGVLYTELLLQFQGSRIATAAVSSIFTGCILGVAPLSGYVITQLGCRLAAMIGCAFLSAGILISAFAPSLEVLYVTFGVIGGIGASLMHTSSHVTVLQNFTKRRALASSMSGSGSSVGTIVIPLLTRNLLDTYGYRGTLVFLSGLVFQCTVAAALFLPGEEHVRGPTAFDHDSDHEMTVSMVTVHKRDDQAACHDESSSGRLLETKKFQLKDDQLANGTAEDRPFLCALTRIRKFMRAYRFVNFGLLTFAFSQGLTNIGMAVPYLFLADVALSRGFDKQKSALLQSSLGIGGIVCRVGFGFVGDIRRFDTLYVVIISLIVFGTLGLIITVLYSYASLMTIACVMGLAGGFPAGMNAIVLVDLVGVENSSIGMGIMFFLAFIPASAGTPIAGYITDKTGGYNGAFYFSSAVAYTSSLIATIVLAWKKRRFRHSNGE